MAFLTTEEARGAARAGLHLSESQVRKSAAPPLTTTYDIFLSHSSEDWQVITGVKELIERESLSVYVDWIEDPQLDRSRVTVATAETLRARMRRCKYLLFATSKASPNSKWMPWELGYFDGMRPGHVGILPLVESSRSSFMGQEYLGLYPLVERIPFTGGAGFGQWTNRAARSARKLSTMAR